MDQIVQQQRRRVKLPHFPRIITATILPGVATGLIWGTFITLVGINLLLTKTRPLSYGDKLFNVLTQPFTSLPHSALAQVLWGVGARSAAKQELAIAVELNPPDKPDVLGATTAPADLLGQWEGAPAREAADLKYWQGVAMSHPDYRDAYIQMASIAYAQGNLIQTKLYLERASGLDPNGKAVSNLLEFIDKRLQ